MLSSRSLFRVSRLAAVLSVLFLACFVTPAAASGSSSGGKPQTGGTLTYLSTNDATGLDPFHLQPHNIAFNPEAEAIYDALLYQVPSTGAIEPGTALSLTSTDNTNWVLKLRPNVKFSDGTAYDATAVKDNWTIDQTTGAAALTYASAIASMNVVDPMTLDFTLKAANSTFPSNVAQGLSYIGSPTAMQKEGASFKTNPVGAGPFTVQQWTPNSSLVLVKNPTYWDAPKPYLDKLVIQIDSNASTAEAAINSGQANVWGVTDPEQAALEHQIDGTTTYAQPFLGGSVLLFNLRQAPFNNPKAREAIALALDRTSFDKTVYGGQGVPATSLFPKGSPFYDPTIHYPTYNHVEAQKLFNELANEGDPVNFTLLAFNITVFSNASQYIQTVLSAYQNVKVNLDIEASTTAVTDYAVQHNFQAIYTTDNATGVPGQFAGTVMSTSAANAAGYANPAVDAAILAAEDSSSVSTQKAQYKIVQKALTTDLPFILMVRSLAGYVVAKNVHNFTFSDFEQPLFQDMWVSS
jgi:peptide/nickel transport system substrate-binding protein